MLFFSLCFYAAASPKYLFYIVVTAITVFGFAIRIENISTAKKAYLAEHKEEITKEEKKAINKREKARQQKYLILALLINLGILAIVKYTNFFILNINGFLDMIGRKGGLSFVNLALPMGISFYTFQAVGYIIDVYRGSTKAQTNFFKFLLFVSFFPQLIQGPISRYNDLSTTLYAEKPFSQTDFSMGLMRIIWGYFKKMVIADRLVTAVLTLISDVNEYRGAFVLVTMLFYTIQLYADFTGGIDITIGIAKMLGIDVTENFIRPFFSTSLKEYWRRWHITMGTWFRDYMFYPLSVSKWMQKLSKTIKNTFGARAGKRVPVYLCSFIVWFTTGLWHGASWNFIVWGLLNFVILMISEELEPVYAWIKNRFAFTNTVAFDIFRMFRTFAIVCVLKIFDCFTSAWDTFGLIGSIFTTGNYYILTDGSLLKLGLSMGDYVVIILGCLTMLGVSIVQARRPIRESLLVLPYPVRAIVFGGMFIVIIVFGAYGLGYDAGQFIYNRF